MKLKANIINADWPAWSTISILFCMLVFVSYVAMIYIYDDIYTYHPDKINDIDMEFLDNLMFLLITFGSIVCISIFMMAVQIKANAEARKILNKYNIDSI